MTRLLVVGAIVLASASARADCPVNRRPTTYLEDVAQAMKGKSCNDAEAIARSCAVGASGDTQIAGAASQICHKDFASNKDDKVLFDKLAKRCDAKYAKLEGTMYVSLAAFCRLSVARVLSSLNRPAE